MLTVGVTGGIGSGKSLVCSVFKVLDVPVYHADTEARRIMNENEEIRRGLQEYFGSEAYAGGTLNRSFLASRIFSDARAREFVNSLVHPAVREDFILWTGTFTEANYIVEEAALLFESGAYRELDMTILVMAPARLRTQRIMARDGIKKTDVQLRMSTQIKPADAAKLADHVVRNDDKRFILPQVFEIHEKIILYLENRNG